MLVLHYPFSEILVLRDGFQGFVGAELIYFRHCHGAALSILSCSSAV
jgi:hypothetical protein